MQVINNITILGIILVGAAVLREREHGTLEHLLAMPVRPVEIMLAKVWANGAVILVASLLSLLLVVRGVLAVPLAGSLVLFALRPRPSTCSPSRHSASRSPPSSARWRSSGSWRSRCSS